MRAYQRDSSGNVTSETWYATSTDAQSGQNAQNTLSYEYDTSGNLVFEGDNTSSDSYSYDSLGRLTSATEVLPDGPTVVLTYGYSDTSDLRTSMLVTIDGQADFQDTYAYNTAGQLVQIVQCGVTGGDAVTPIEVNFSYDTYGNLITLSRLQDGQVVATTTYSYDSSGRLTGVNTSQGDTVPSYYTLAYAGFSGVGSFVNLNYNGGIPTVWLPGGVFLPTDDSTVDAFSLNSPLNSVDLLTGVTSVDGTASYSYDSTGQLIAAAYSGSQSAEAYSYDASGNRTSANGQTYIVGPNNEILSDGIYNYSYDKEGNLVKQVSLATGAETDYAWDARNRLVGATMKSADGTIIKQITYLYDAENRWIGTDIAVPGQVAKELRFVYSGNQIIAVFEGTGTLTANDLTDRILANPAVTDQVLADEEVTDLAQPGTVDWLFSDPQGTIRDIAQFNPTTGTTSVVNHIIYNAYGQVVSQTNAAAADCLFGYDGMATDAETGFVHADQRWYNPSLSQWMTEDPTGLLGQQTNTRAFVGNSPTNAVDLSGLWLIGTKASPAIHEFITYQAARQAGYVQDGASGWSLSGLWYRYEVLSPAGQRSYKFGEGLYEGVRAVDAPDGMTALMQVYRLNKSADESAIREYWNRAEYQKTIRSHFGSEQFRHGMTPHENPMGTAMASTPQELKKQIIDWICAKYDKALKAMEQAALDRRMYRSQCDRSAGVASTSAIFTRLEGDLFAAGRELGQAIHTLEDLYCPSHVQRNALGQIEKFQDYAAQNHDLHAQADQWQSISGTTPTWSNWKIRQGYESAVQAVAGLIAALNSGTSTDKVRKWLDTTILALAPNAQVGGTDPDHAGK